MRRFKLHSLAMLFVWSLLCAAPNMAVAGKDRSVSLSGGTLESDLPSPQEIGKTITWTATADELTTPVYRISISKGDLFVIVRDFSEDNTFVWNPVAEGDYKIRLEAKEKGSDDTALQTEKDYTIKTRLKDTNAIATLTSHPLVALYSAPPCEVGSKIFVRFRVKDSNDEWFMTNILPCEEGKSMNFLVGGMKASTDYEMQSVVVRDDRETPGDLKYVETGTIPTNVILPDTSVLQPADDKTSMKDRVLYYSGVAFEDDKGGPIPLATDLDGNVIWYYFDNEYDYGGINTATTPVRGGTFLLLVAGANQDQGQYLREIDLMGNPVHELHVSTVNKELEELGENDEIGSFDHEAIRFPNGYTLVMGSIEKLMKMEDPPKGIKPNEEVVVLGAMIIALDEDWHAKWCWNVFGHLDPERTKQQTYELWCQDNAPGCPPLFLGDKAYDWIHGNAIAYSPEDKHLIFSMRSQDWVIKINYDDGNGNGNIIWKLGDEGDFQGLSGDDWFSHQHGAKYVGKGIVSLFDNGNLRCIDKSSFVEGCSSRGQVIQLNESVIPHTAEFVLNADLGNFSMALGMSQKLSNSNYHFIAGCILEKFSDITDFMANAIGKSIEVIPDSLTGTLNYIQLATKGATYRSFRLQSMYKWPDYEGILYVSRSDVTCGGKCPCYSTVQGAIDGATSGNSIKVEEGTYPENIDINGEKAIFLQGGYDATFTTTSGCSTVMKMRIGKGTVTLNQGCLGLAGGTN